MQKDGVTATLHRSFGSNWSGFGGHGPESMEKTKTRQQNVTATLFNSCNMSKKVKEQWMALTTLGHLSMFKGITTFTSRVATTEKSS